MNDKLCDQGRKWPWVLWRHHFYFLRDGLITVITIPRMVCRRIENRHWEALNRKVQESRYLSVHIFKAFRVKLKQN